MFFKKWQDLCLYIYNAPHTFENTRISSWVQVKLFALILSIRCIVPKWVISVLSLLNILVAFVEKCSLFDVMALSQILLQN